MLALALVVLAGLLVLPSKAGAVQLGVADSDGDTLRAPSFSALGVRMVRAVAPYDVALTSRYAGGPAGERRREFDEWVSGAAARGIEPLVTFEGSRGPIGYDSSGNPVAPTREQYGAALRTFLSTYPSVRKLAPWNEPNLREPGNALRGQPALAASYYLEMLEACREVKIPCTVAAGEFAGIPGDPYVDSYRAALGSVRPSLWGVHTHTDPNRFQAGVSRTAPATRFFLAKLPGRLWIDEVGAYYRDENRRVWGDSSQRRTTSFILGLARLSPRIERIYYYNLANECSSAAFCAIQDRGLVSPTPWDGTSVSYDGRARRRGAFTVIRDGGPVIVPDAVPPDTAIADAPPEKTRDTSAFFRAVATEAGSRFACSLDGRDFAACPSPHGYDSLRRGRHSFRVRATDPAGNTDSSHAAHRWTVLPRFGFRLSVRRRHRLAAALRRGIPTRVRCSEACRVSAEIVIGRRAARRLGLTRRRGRRPVRLGRGRGSLRRRGNRRVTVRLGRTARRRLWRARSVRVELRVRVRAAARTQRRVKRRLRLR